MFIRTQIRIVFQSDLIIKYYQFSSKLALSLIGKFKLNHALNGLK